MSKCLLVQTEKIWIFFRTCHHSLWKVFCAETWDHHLIWTAFCQTMILSDTAPRGSNVNVQSAIRYQHMPTCTKLDKILRARFAPGNFFPPSRGFIFPPQCRINSLAICSMLNLEAVISTVFATFRNHFYGNCSILELETDRKSSILELGTLISAGIGDFWS